MARRKTSEQPGTPAQPRACVIGAGIGGLALAIRLQAAGQPTVLVDAKPQPGGMIRTWQRDGFVFEEGPAAISDPAPLRELWSLTGEDMAKACLDAFLAVEFGGGRHAGRVDKLSNPPHLSGATA